MTALVFSLGLASCKTAPERPAEEEKKPVPELSQEEQNQKAVEIFYQLMEYADVFDRKQFHDKIEGLYMEIIDKYPKALLTQEAFWNLTRLYINEYEPIPNDKVLALHRRFVALYPDSLFREEIENIVAADMRRNGRWKELMELYTPAVKKYIQTGELKKPTAILLYAEAKFHLGDYAEAEKGFKIVLALFPKSAEGTMSRSRLNEIENIKKTGKK